MIVFSQVTLYVVLDTNVLLRHLMLVMKLKDHFLIEGKNKQRANLNLNYLSCQIIVHENLVLNKLMCQISIVKR